MAYGHFASITADLLARKGEARPWPMTAAKTVTGPCAEAGQTAGPQAVVPPPVVAPPPAAAPPKMPALRKCTIRVSAHDYERLGIAAVKDDTSRQHLLQQALAQFLDAKEAQYRSACRCMAAEPCGACDGP